jgi:hypothetical protein
MRAESEEMEVEAYNKKEEACVIKMAKVLRGSYSQQSKYMCSLVRTHTEWFAARN